MNKFLKQFSLLLLFLFLVASNIKAQADYKSEAEFKKEAAKLFNEEEYVKAYPLYTQLVSLYKKDPDYNYRLGVCMIYSIEEKEKAIPYLEFALRTPDQVEKEAHFYLAKAYHLTYRFDDAIKRYKVYKREASKGKIERLQVDRQIEMCENGKRLLGIISDLQVVEKIEMNREDFFRAYDISSIGGKLLVKPDEKEFKTSLDKKKKENSIIYLAPNGKQIFFSSYGENEKNGKDIYRILKKPNGEWEKAELLGKNINTPYDEDFPFLHPNGKVLYFCSKGHNSMGGYDVFKSIYNETTKEWGPPENLNFPINTPDDDIMYITDKDEKTAFFSSGRASAAGKIAVYHINVERKPVDFAMIYGTVIKNHKNQDLGVKITVKNLSNNNNIVGMYHSLSDDGRYNIKLPNGGKFLFTVESPGFATQSEVVEVPVQKEFKGLRQELSFDPTSDKLQIKNFFDESSDSSYLYAIDLIKEKAKLNVSSQIDFASNENNSVSDNNTTPENNNSTQIDNVSASETKDSTPVASRELSNDDIVKIAYRDAKETENEANELKEQADLSLSFANQKNELAQNKLKEVNSLMQEASKEKDNVKKQELNTKANEANEEAQQLNSETVAAFNIAKKIEATALAKQEEAAISKQYAEELESAVKSNNSKESVAKLDQLEKKLDSLSQANASSVPVLNSFKLDEENKKRELANAQDDSKYMKQDIADNETIIQGLTAEAQKENNAKIKEALYNQIEELKQENVDKQKRVVDNDAKVAQLEKEYEILKNETALVSSVVEQSKTENNETASAKAATVDKTRLEEQVNSIKANTGETASVSSRSTSSNNSETNQNTNTSVEEPKTVAASSNESNTENSVAINTSNNTSSNNNFKYSNTISETQITRADSLNKVADDMQEEANQFRTWGTENLSKKQKKERAKKADQLEKQSIETKEKANQLYADGNKTEYTGNQKQLDEAAKQNAGSTSSDLFKAELLTDEANRYFAEANADREKAKKAKSADEKEAALEAAKGNELVALEKQKEALNIYKSYSPANTQTVSNTGNQTSTENNLTSGQNNTNNVNNSSSSSATQVEAATSAKTMEDINSKYEADIAATNAIQNPGDREKAKADVYRNWSEAIDSDLEKQKQDYETTTDPVLKEQIAKRIKAAEDSSALKQEQASESRKKAENLKQQELIAETQNTTKANNQNNENSTAATTNRTNGESVKVSPSVGNETSNNEVLLNNNNTRNDNTANETNNIIEEESNTALTEEPSYEYSNPVSSQQIEQAANLTDQADELLAKSIISELEPTSNVSETEKNKQKAEAQKMIEDAQKKKVESAQLVAKANTAEYNSKRAELDQLAASSSGSSNSDALQAAKLKNEAQDFFNIATEERKKAENAQAYFEKEMMLDDARENELAALSKQQEAIALYNKSKSGSATASNQTNTNTKQNTTEDPGTSLTANNSASSAAGKQFAYSSQQALNKSVKAATLNKQAEDLMTQSLDLKTQAIAQSNSDAKNSMYAQSEELMKEAHAKKGEAAELSASANTEEYNANKKDLEQCGKASQSNNSADMLKIEILGDEAESYFSKAKTQRQEATTTESYYAKEAIYEDASANELLALGKQKEALELCKKYNLLAPVAIVKTENSRTDLSDNPTTTDDEIKLAPNEAFETQTAAAYSSSNRIPIDTKLPEGLIFKVQIGAFKKPIPQSLFKGIKPITGETTPKGFIRYTAGVFTKYSNANKVKNKIVKMGYKDAFVVAFLNGKRIPINEAYALAEGTPSTVLQANNSTQNKQTQTTQVQQSNNTTPSSANDDANPNAVIKSKELEAVGGLFYTVQVGVYAQEVKAAKLYNMAPLFKDKASNGYLRYYTGLYTSVARATDAKEIAVDVGVKDAFITAYYNGKRVSIAEAKKYEAQGAKFPSTPDVDKLPYFKANNTTATPPRNPNAGNEKPADEATKKQLETATQKSQIVPVGEGITYKVQIGAFYDEVPLEMANKFLKIAKKGIQNYKDNNGMTIYTVGDIKTYDEANSLRKDVVAEGLTDAFVVAYRNGEKVSIEDAKQSNK